MIFSLKLLSIGYANSFHSKKSSCTSLLQSNVKINPYVSPCFDSLILHATAKYMAYTLLQNRDLNCAFEYKKLLEEL